MLDKDKFADRLRTLRHNRGISTRSLAAAIGLKSHGAIAQFEKGTSLPAIDTLVKLADYFKVTLDYLVGITDIIPTSINSIAENAGNSSEPTANTNQIERQELSDQLVQYQVERKTEELIEGLDEESMVELHKFLRYLHARQTLDGDGEISCGLDINEELKKA